MESTSFTTTSISSLYNNFRKKEKKKKMDLFFALAFLHLPASSDVLGLHYSVESGIDYQQWAHSKDSKEIFLVSIN